MFPAVASATQAFIMERVSIYIDGENFYFGIKSINEKYTDFKFDFQRYIERITKGRKLIDVYYIVAPLKQNLNPELYTKQQKLLSRLKKAGYKVILCKRQKRDKEDGTYTHKVKEDDIRIALQMQKDAYDNKFDIALLFSGDGDFVPLPEYLNQKGKKMELAYFEGCASVSLLRACKFKATLINKKILNKYFYREHKTQL